MPLERRCWRHMNSGRWCFCIKWSDINMHVELLYHVSIFFGCQTFYLKLNKKNHIIIKEVKPRGQNRKNQTNYTYQENLEVYFHTTRNQKNTKLIAFWVCLEFKFWILGTLLVFHNGGWTPLRVLVQREFLPNYIMGLPLFNYVRCNSISTHFSIFLISSIALHWSLWYQASSTPLHSIENPRLITFGKFFHLLTFLYNVYALVWS